MKVIKITEECHGFIGLAKDMRSAFEYLVKKEWIDEKTEVFEPNPLAEERYIRIGTVMKDLDRDIVDSLMFLYATDENYFADLFSFVEVEVYESA